MPIKGFLRERMPRLGKIHLGERVAKNGKEFPRDLGCFRVPEEVATVYGPDPTVLRVMVPSVNIDEWFPYSLKRYGTDRLLCRGDAETALCYNAQTGEWDEQECAYRDCPHYQRKACTEVGNLMVVLPDVNIWGVYQIDTGSWHGINNVYNAYGAFVQRLEIITGDPSTVLRAQFELSREEQNVAYTAQDGTRKTVSKHILNLRAPALSLDGAKQLAAALRGAPQLPPTTAPALPAGDEVPTEWEQAVPEGEVPEPDEEAPADLYPDATPTGSTMGQRAAWAALLEQVQALGKSITVFESSVCKAVTKSDTERFDDLSEAEATAAIDQAAQMIATWQSQTTPQEQPAAPATPAQTGRPTTRSKPAPTPTPAPEPEPAPTPTPEPVGAGVPAGQGGLGF